MWIGIDVDWACVCVCVCVCMRICVCDCVQFPKPPANKLGVVEDHYKVLATAAFTGIGVRMLDLEPTQHLTLHSEAGCQGALLRIPPGSDICDHSFVPMHDCTRRQGSIPEDKCFEASSTRVKSQVRSVTVPAGMRVHITDKCETSDPYALDAAFVVGHCDNSQGAAPLCCNVTSANALTFRSSIPSAPTVCTAQPESCPTLVDTKFIHEALHIEYSAVTPEGLVKTHLKRSSIKADLSGGNFPVTLLMGTPSSGLTMVEFVLKVLTTLDGQLPCVAVCCSVLQRVAVCCGVLQGVALLAHRALRWWSLSSRC